jgi:hypothetical protein
MTYAFNLSQFAPNVDSSGKAILTSGQAVTGILPVANGGSGAATFSSGSVLLGSGTSSFGTVAPGTSGNLLTSNGTTWTSASAPLTGQNIVIFNTNVTWTVPAGVTKAIVWVYGGGGGASVYYPYSGNVYGTAYAGQGGACCAYISGLSDAIAITVGSGGAATDRSPTDGGTSAFGSYVICTGGIKAYSTGNVVTGANGTVTVNGATTLRSGAGLDMGIIGDFSMQPKYGSSPNPYGTNTQTWTTSSARAGTGGVAYGSNNVNFWTGNVGCGGAIIIQY